MVHRLELAAKGLAFERVATGGFVVIAPGRAIGALATSVVFLALRASAS
jgi:hypothetical protein